MAVEPGFSEVRGLAELKQRLGDLPLKLRNKILMPAMKDAMRLVRDAAREKVPMLAFSTATRTRGLLKKRLSVRVSKASKRSGNLGVFVNIRPNVQGANSPKDPYYWRWIEFGAKAHAIKPGKGHHGLSIPGIGVVPGVMHPGAKRAPFLQPAADKLPAALARFEANIAQPVKDLNKP